MFVRIPMTLATALALLIAGSATAQSPAVSVAYVPEAAVRPDEASWYRLPEGKLALSEQLIAPPVGGGTVGKIAVRAMHDAEWLSIRLEWADATPNRTVGVDAFRDAVAIGFPLAESDTPPSPFMGDADHPVAIWQWTADLEADARGQGGFAERYPHTEGVWYFPQDSQVRREVRAWRGLDPVVEFVATGWGTLSRRASGEVRAVSGRKQGHWLVVLRRRLSSGDPEGVSFKPGESTHLIAAVWDGGHGEVNGRKSVTLGWTPFTLEATLPAKAVR